MPDVSLIRQRFQTENSTLLAWKSLEESPSNRGVDCVLISERPIYSLLRHGASSATGPTMSNIGIHARTTEPTPAIPHDEEAWQETEQATIPTNPAH